MIKIRFAKPTDLPQIRKVKRQSGNHQRMDPNRRMLSCEELERDGFLSDGEPQYFKCIVAERNVEDGGAVANSEILGCVLYYYSYGAFEGKSMNLEDLAVSENCRGQGVGSILFKTLAQICLEVGLARINLEVFSFNDTALKFYDKNGGRNSSKIDGWLTYGFDMDGLQKLIKSDTSSYSSLENYLVRPAQPSDCSRIVAYMVQLAELENMADRAKLTGEDLIRDGFQTENPYFHSLVVTTKGSKSEEAVVIGYALYYYTYSAWDGKGIHLEDFFVDEKHRGKGIGTLVMKEMANITVKGGFYRLTLECLESLPARKFYEKLNAVNYTATQSFYTYRFLEETLKKLAADAQIPE